MVEQEIIKDIVRSSDKHRKIMMWTLISSVIFLSALIIIVLIWIAVKRMMKP